MSIIKIGVVQSLVGKVINKNRENLEQTLAESFEPGGHWKALICLAFLRCGSARTRLNSSRYMQKRKAEIRGG